MDSEIDVEVAESSGVRHRERVCFEAQKLYVGAMIDTIFSGLAETTSSHADFGKQGNCETAEPLHGHMHPLPSFTGHALALGVIAMAGTALDFVETESVIEAYGSQSQSSLPRLC